jgi:hypothetical protein
MPLDYKSIDNYSVEGLLKRIVLLDEQIADNHRVIALQQVEIDYLKEHIHTITRVLHT